MGISIPLKNVKSVSDTGTSSTSSNVFILPSDASEVVVRVYTGATFSGTSPTADVYFQTSEDGGTTWRDCVHFGQITGAIALQNAQFQPISVSGSGGSRGLGAFVGSVAASTAGAGVATGLPILGIANRIFIVYGGTIGVNSGINVDVFMNGQDQHE